MSSTSSGSKEVRRPRMVLRTRVMQFSYELVNGSEAFVAQWINDADGLVHRCWFDSASGLKAWLLDDQRYGEAEADALIERLRAPFPSGTVHSPHASRYAVQ